jgi:hypothetical protein
MRKQQEIRELIAEHGVAPEERQAMQAVAEALEEKLAPDVPFRPAFQTELRQQLMVRARQALIPWYRKPAVWGPSLSVAAAAAVLMIGLQIWQEAPVETPSPTPSAWTPPWSLPQDPITSNPPEVEPNLVSDASELSLVGITVPDQPLPAEHPGPASIAHLDLARGLPVFQLVQLTDQAQFSRVAEGLGLTQQPVVQSDEITVIQGAVTLVMEASGRVTFRDAAVHSIADRPEMDLEGAQEAAQRFLLRAGLPIPSQPVVTEEVLPTTEQTVLAVSYMPRVGDFPVVNAQTIIHVAPQNQVVWAEAYVPSREESRGNYKAVMPTAALVKAQNMGGGTFEKIDLVYVRTPGEHGLFLEPFWRLFGTDTASNRVARFVPALASR